MRRITAAVLCLGLALSAGSALSQALDNPVLGKAEALVRAGKAEEAWELLAPLEREYAGQPDFDYLLGVAALESGRPNRATFVLERVVTVNPGHLAARLEMARAYFALRDYERAEREFNFILQSSPLTEVRLLSQSYLGWMRQVTRPERAGLSGYAEVSVGRDTNVAAAAAQSSIFIPGLGIDFVPDPLFQRRADDFVALGAGFEYAQPLEGEMTVIAAAEVRSRWHSDLDPFDARQADLQAALLHRLDEQSAMQYSMRHDHYELDNARYRTTQSLAGEWSRTLSPRTRIALSGQAHRIRYQTDDARASSSDLFVAGAIATRVLEASTRTSVTAGLYLGEDNAVAGRTDGDRRMRGLGFALERRLLPRVEAYARFSLLSSDYETQNRDFGVRRRDRQRDAAAGVGWEFATGWLLLGQLSGISNRSNLPLNDYSRTETSITLRRIWD